MEKPRKPATGTTSGTEGPGFAVRRVAADMLDGVLRRHRALDELLNSTGEFVGLATRDRALVRILVATVLRRLGTLRHLVGLFLDRGLPAQAPRVENALLIGAAQILFLNVPDHAAVDLSVQLVQADRRAAGFAGLINAVLRRGGRGGAARLAALHKPPPHHPPLPLQRLPPAYRDRSRHCRASRQRAGARPHRQKRSGSLGETARRPRACDRLGARERDRRGERARWFCRRRVVGSGCRRIAAGAAPWRCSRPAGCRPVRPAGPRDCATLARWRQRDRGRSRARAVATIAR